jgi:hypothetical protein
MPFFFIPYIVMFIALAAAPYVPQIAHSRGNQILSAGVAHFEIWPFAAGLLASAFIVWLTRRRFEGHVLAMIACAAILLTAFTYEGRRHVYHFYDLSPLAHVLKPYGGHPIAYIGKYAGEIGFTARLTGPVQETDTADLGQWFQDHPDGFAVMRHENYETLPQFNTMYTQAYKGDQRISVLTPTP